MACDIHWTGILVSQAYLRIVQRIKPQNLLKLIQIMFPKLNITQNLTLDQTFHFVGVFV